MDKTNISIRVTYNMNYYNDIVGEIHIFQLSKGRSGLQCRNNFLTFTGDN